MPTNELSCAHYLPIIQGGEMPNQPRPEDAPQACTKRRYEVTQADLPLSCPPRDMRVWDAHPRVYLPIEAEGQVVCPYCEAEYVLLNNLEK